MASDFCLPAKRDEGEGPLPATQKRKREDEEELVKKEGVVVPSDSSLPEKRDGEEGPLPVTQKRRLKDEEELAGKVGNVMASNCSLLEKRDEEEGSGASDLDDDEEEGSGSSDPDDDEEEGSEASDPDDDDDDYDEGYVSYVDPKYFSKSYWVAQEQQTNPYDLEVHNFICRNKVKPARIETRHPAYVKAGAIVCFNVKYSKREDLQALINGLTEEAIQKYNSENGEAYKFRRVVNLNALMVAGIVYYISFEAENTKASDNIETFETCAFIGLAGEREISFCRPELKSLQSKVIEEMSKRTLIVAEDWM